MFPPLMTTTSGTGHRGHGARQQRRNAHRARPLGDHVLLAREKRDAAREGGLVDRDHLVERVTADVQRVLVDRAREAVGQSGENGRLDDASRFERSCQCARVRALRADDADVRLHFTDDMLQCRRAVRRRPPAR